MTTNPRTRVVVYLVLTFALSAVPYTLCIRNGLRGTYIFGLMWCPAVAALLASLLTGRSLAEVGWRPGGARYLLAGWWVPMAYSWPAYLLVWATGLGGFPKEHAVERIRTLLHLHSGPTALPLVAYYLVDAVVGVLLGCLSAAGEEIGWRGFLVPELMRFNSFKATALLSGLVWSAWHVPVIVWSGYNSGTPTVYAVSCFAAMVVSISFVFAWIRMRSGSVWPAVVMHASHNAIVQSYLDALTIDRGHTAYFTGEFGCAMLPLTLLAGWIAYRLQAEGRAS